MQLDAHSSDAWVNFGVASWHSNQRRDAERAFRHALVLSPGLETPALNLTQMWRGIGRYDLAMDMLDVALADNPNSSRLHQARAETARLMGDDSTARAHALAALEQLRRVSAPHPAPISESAGADSVEHGRQQMLSTMTTVCDCLSGAGIDHHLIGAVVLGIAREGEPFHGDKDLDLVLPANVERAQLTTLFDEDFELMRVPLVSNAHRWVMGLIDPATGIGVDMYFAETTADGVVRRCLGWPDQLMYEYPSHAVGPLRWRGRDWPVPAPLPSFLTSNYGADWREPMRQVGARQFDKCWYDSQLSCPGLVAESLPRAINLVLLRILSAFRQKQWQKVLALCDQTLARQSLQQIEALRDRLLASGIR